MSPWYYWLCGFFLLQATEALGVFDRLLYGEWIGKPGDKFTQGLNILMIVTSLLLVARAYRRLKPIRAGVILSSFGGAFLTTSTFWSIDPPTTTREAILYGILLLGSIGVAANLEARQLMQLLTYICLFAAAASVVLLIIYPAAATVAQSDSIEFRGIFSQKNFLGEVMVVGVLASLHLLRSGERNRLRHFSILLVLTCVALASKSATSCLTIFCFFSAHVLIALFRRGGVARLLSGVGVILLFPIVVVAAVFPDTFLEMLGKDPTLTGRTELWTYVLADIAQRPLLGWGYSAFWSPNDPAAMEISDTLKWFVPQAHNGLLEMLLNVGAMGTAFFIFLWGRNIWLALQCMRTPATALAVTTLLSCFGIFIVGISETVLMDRGEPSTSVFYITGLMCERAVRVARKRDYASLRRSYPRGSPAPNNLLS
jgi:exopolysaccharide production protein ExoQ